jgi:hypothetical protein
VNNITFILGNGESRKSINVDSLREFGPVWGCNKIHQDWHVDNLVCVDQRQVEIALKAGIHEKSNLWTRRRWAPEYNGIPSINYIPDFREEGVAKWQKQWHWNSGPIAMFLACEQGAELICLFGFDFYGIAGRNNNIYKGTLGYDPVDHRANDPSHVIQQFKLLAEWYPNTQFVQVQPPGWQVPEMWRDVANLNVDTTEQFFQTLLSINA